MILKLVIRIISTACEAVEKPINNLQEIFQPLEIIFLNLKMKSQSHFGNSQNEFENKETKNKF